MSIRQVFTDNMKRRQIWLPAREEEVVEDLSLLSEDFESYAVDYDMTTGDWTWSQYGGEVGQFKVSVGKYGKTSIVSGNWTGGFIYDGAESNAWTDYEVTFDIISHTGRFIFAFRMGEIAGYWLQCIPGVVNESQIKKGQRNFLSGAVILNSQTSPNPVTSVKIRIVGTSIKVYYNGSDIPTHDFTDATYAAGSIGTSAYQAGWEVDNIVVTEL